MAPLERAAPAALAAPAGRHARKCHDRAGVVVACLPVVNSAARGRNLYDGNPF